MEVQPLEAIIAELESKDWLVAGCAIRKLKPHGEAATVALHHLFALTRHDKAPVVSDSRTRIKGLGKHAVPFLRCRAEDECPENRAMAISLLIETGFRWATSTLLVDQVLDERTEDLPDWGTDPDEIINVFRAALQDESLLVRFTAASALEEFGRNLDETVPVFIEVLRHGTLDQQNWAALYLGRIGPMAITASEALRQVAESETEYLDDYAEWQSKYTRLAASNALKRICCTDSDNGNVVGQDTS
jgi:HEAT repeat protein